MTMNMYPYVQGTPTFVNLNKSAHPVYFELMRFVNTAMYNEKTTSRTIGRSFSALVDVFRVYGFEVYGPRSTDGDIHQALHRIMHCVRKHRGFSLPARYNRKNIVNTKHNNNRNYVNRAAISYSDHHYPKRGEIFCAFKRNSRFFDRMNLGRAMKFVFESVQTAQATRPNLLIARMGDNFFTQLKN